MAARRPARGVPLLPSIEAPCRGGRPRGLAYYPTSKPCPAGTQTAPSSVQFHELTMVLLMWPLHIAPGPDEGKRRRMGIFSRSRQSPAVAAGYGARRHRWGAEEKARPQGRVREGRCRARSRVPHHRIASVGLKAGGPVDRVVTCLLRSGFSLPVAHMRLTRVVKYIVPISELSGLKVSAGEVFWTAPP